jgi:zinc transporter ZupT
MDPIIWQLIVMGVLAGLANVLGGLILFPAKLHSTYRGAVKYLLALGAGFMLAVTLFELLPKSIVLWQTAKPESNGNLYFPMLLLLGGYLLTQFFEHTIAPHFHLGADIHSHQVISTKSAYAGVGGLFIHTFFDGVSIAAASLIDIRIGFLVFLAVVLHKLPEGFTIGSMVLAAGKGAREVLIATSVIGAATLLGVILFYFIGRSFEGSILYALPIAAGVTLYVAASDLIPEVNHHGGKKPLVSLSVFAGVALFFAVHFLVHELFEH